MNWSSDLNDMQFLDHFILNCNSLTEVPFSSLIHWERRRTGGLPLLWIWENWSETWVIHRLCIFEGGGSVVHYWGVPLGAQFWGRGHLKGPFRGPHWFLLNFYFFCVIMHNFYYRQCHQCNGANTNLHTFENKMSIPPITSTRNP